MEGHIERKDLDAIVAGAILGGLLNKRDFEPGSQTDISEVMDEAVMIAEGLVDKVRGYG